MSTPTTSPTVQKIGSHTARTVRNRETGERFAILDERNRIPLAILPLGAGRDAWMRKVVCKCDYCDNRHEAGTMEQGHKGLQCAECFRKAGEELEAQDNA